MSEAQFDEMWLGDFEIDQVTAPTHFMAICDECRQARTFGGERERDLWMNHHPHLDDA
jgi:hypothetical protein